MLFLNDKIEPPVDRKSFHYFLGLKIQWVIHQTYIFAHASANASHVSEPTPEIFWQGSEGGRMIFRSANSAVASYGESLYVVFVAVFSELYMIEAQCTVIW